MQRTSTDERYVYGLDEVEAASVALVGGKAANLGELMRIDGLRVPPGFCVTSAAFDRARAAVLDLDELVMRLAEVEAGDRRTIAELGAAIRAHIESLVIPAAIASAIGAAVAGFDQGTAFAVRSSATAEDQPGASFAGQHDTVLGAVGETAVLRQVRRCWASLFTDRAIAYRARHGIDHRAARMAVVVQQMVTPDNSGVLFTADPATGNRMVVTIEAIAGLGERLVSGEVNPDRYLVRRGAVSAAHVERERALLTDEQALRLAQLGRRIEAHLGRPQDIEWCLVGDDITIVQSRPITTLFPVPATGDDQPHVYVSVGHQQMMTDAMRPLGWSFWQLMALRPMYQAGGRLFVDVAAELASPERRAGVLMLGRSDPLIGDALQAIVDRGDVLRPVEGDPADAPSLAPAGTPPGAGPATIETDPAIVAALVADAEAALAVLRRDIAGLSGVELLDFIAADVERWRGHLDPRSMQVIVAAIEAGRWLDEHVEEWFGERNVADELAQSVPGNITSEMGLALLDVADAIRPYPDVVARLEQVAADPGADDPGGDLGADPVGGDLLAALRALDGGAPAHDAIAGWLDRYGVRGVGEIDITRSRWSEQPAKLVPLILGNVRNFTHGEAARRAERGLEHAAAVERELLRRIRERPDGDHAAAETAAAIRRLRTFAGYREFPKYALVARTAVYRRALLEEADRLVAAGVLDARDDVCFLTFDELREVVAARGVDGALLRRRRDEFGEFEALTPPRVMTSDGEVVAGRYRRDDLLAGALVGLGASAGVAEGRARVVHDVATADLVPGDILVTTYTDPSWTPLFLTAGALVTEVGGRTTHGAVVAREYGLPAVVGVERATALILDGQRVRVDGTNGLVEILSAPGGGPAGALTSAR